MSARFERVDQSEGSALIYADKGFALITLMKAVL